MSAGKPTRTLVTWVQVSLAALVCVSLAVVLCLIVVLVADDLGRDLTTDYGAYEVAQARVVRTESSGLPSNNTQMWVSYTVGGREYESVWIGQMKGADSKYSGGTVEVLYHPDDPGDPIVREYTEWAPVRMLGALLLAVSIGTVVVCAVGAALQEYRQHRAQKAAGAKAAEAEGGEEEAAG